MSTIQPSVLRRQAGDMLQKAPYDPKRLVLIHTSVALGASLLVTIVNYILNQQIAGTGGLSGMGLRSILSTVQAVLELAILVGTPFWEFGLLFAALRWARGEKADFQNLLQGFRRFGSVLALRLLRGGLFMLMAIAVIQLSSTVFLLTPFSKPLLEVMEPVITAAGNPQQLEAILTPELLVSVMEACIPLMLIAGALYALIALPVFYRLRFADFAVMDGAGAVSAMVQSVRATRKKSLQLVKLDFSFWWFYLLQLLCVAISYGNIILPALGITFPFSEDTALFLFYVLGSLCQLLLLWQYQASVLTCYGLAYGAFGVRPPTPREQSLPHTATWNA